MLPLPVAAPAPAHTVAPGTSAHPISSLPSSPTRRAADLSAGFKETEHIPSRSSPSASPRESLQSPRISVGGSTRGLYNFPFTSAPNVVYDRINRTVTIPYDDMCHFLRNDVLEWFRDRDLDADAIVRKYDQNGKLKEVAKDESVDDAPEKVSTRQNWKLKWKTRWLKIDWRKRTYDDVSISKILWFLCKSQRESYRTNPYNLSSIYYLLIFLCLALWAVGSIICGHYEARAKMDAGDSYGYMVVLCRGVLGCVPAIVQITLFLFPPLIAQY